MFFLKLGRRMGVFANRY